MHVSVLSARGIRIGSKTRIIVLLGLHSVIVDRIRVVVWNIFFFYDDLWTE